MRCVLLLLFIAAGCGQPAKVNPCATKGATYSATFSERSGTCGAVPETIINVSSSGEITTSAGKAQACDSYEGSGCTVRSAGCHSSSGGVTCTSTGSVTFADDGAFGSGILTMQCSGAASCVSTYDLTYLRL